MVDGGRGIVCEGLDLASVDGWNDVRDGDAPFESLCLGVPARTAGWLVA